MSNFSVFARTGRHIEDMDKMKTRGSAIAERPHCKVLPKVEDWDWETIFCGYYRSVFNHFDVIGLHSYRIR